MPLKKYACMPSGRMAAYFAVAAYTDLAVLDFSTQGHGLYNYGHMPWLLPHPSEQNLFTTHITETDVALGGTVRLSQAVKEAALQKHSCALLIPSAIGGVLGHDFGEIAERASTESGVDVFTFPLKLHDDFYKGGEAVTCALVRKFCTQKAPKQKATFVVLGGGYTQYDRQVNAEVARLISENFGYKCLFDNLNACSVRKWSECTRAELIVVTSHNAVLAAEYLRDSLEVPLVYFRPLGKAQEDKALLQIAHSIGGNYTSVEDVCYNGVSEKFANILRATRPEIVCYADTDRLQAIKEFFSVCDISVTCYCSHLHSKEKFMEINEFTDLYADSDALVLSYDSVCRKMKYGVTIEYTGQQYHLLTPLCPPQCGKNGAYVLMKETANILI